MKSKRRTFRFWKVRDPEPSTPKNEFREEHYRRINYANLWFGRGTPTQGWRTDMGRIYIKLGQANSPVQPERRQCHQ